MKIAEANEVGRSLIQKVPWQEIADSPTVRFYTDWSRFEGYVPIDVESPRQFSEVGPCEFVVINGRLAGVGRCEAVGVESVDVAFQRVSIGSKILALHAAALREVVMLKIRGSPKVPVVVKLLSDAPQGRHVASHLLVETDRGAAGAVVVFVDSAPGVMHTAVIEGRSAGDLDFVLVSRGAGPQYVHSAVDVEGVVRARPLVVGGSMNAVREEYYVGERAFVEVVGLELGVGESRIDHVVSVVNVGREGRGYAKLLGVAKDKSFVTQRAVGRITKTGVWSDNAVEGVIYIAGEGAVANTQPVILVETGEVSGARHSAADASLDEEREFLLRARGVPKAEIPALIVASLVDQYLSSLSESARGVVEEILRKAV